jgi:hypothetical protein
MASPHAELTHATWGLEHLVPFLGVDWHPRNRMGELPAHCFSAQDSAFGLFPA